MSSPLNVTQKETRQTTFSELQLFYTKRDGYTFDEQDALTAHDLIGVLELASANGYVTPVVYLPLVVDSEYEHPAAEPFYSDTNKPHTINITAQVNGIRHTQGYIFAYPDLLNNSAAPRHPLVSTGFVCIDYLKYLGIDVELERVEDSRATDDLPVIEFHLFMHFAVADLARIFTGVYQQDILNLCARKNPDSYITQERRLRCVTEFNKRGGVQADWVSLSYWKLTVNGVPYAVRLNITDTVAVHGNASYADFCRNSGVELDAKDNFTREEKGCMSEMYTSRPADFDAYALGDLNLYEALEGNARMFSYVWQALGLGHRYTRPKLTIGSTVRDLFEAALTNLFGAEADVKEVIKTYCANASAETLRQLDGTGALLSKVDGGRCRNNRPTHTKAMGVLADIDISGCYGEGLRSQLYPLGTPVVLSNNSKGTAILVREPLGKMLKRYRDELVPGLWVARVSSNGKLKYAQDFIASWLAPKNLKNLVTDTEKQASDEVGDGDDGDTKVFTHEVVNGIVTHDILQVIENVCSPRQRKELLENLLVESLAYYPASERASSVEELLAVRQEHKGENRTVAARMKGRTTIIHTEQECHAWYAISLGDLLVSRLLLERKKHPKKTPLNELFKLVINTIYGDLVSPYFAMGNVVVGNNITARARTLAWCLEKGLQTYQTITDGGVFDLNQVVCGNLNAENAVALYRKKATDYKLMLKPLGGVDNISLSWDGDVPLLTLHKQGIGTQLVGKNAIQWVDTEAWKHLQTLFPRLDVLHKPSTDVYGNERSGQFSFETKQLYISCVFHGTANYLLDTGNGSTPLLKMRSYEKGQHQHYRLVDAQLVDAGQHNPAQTFMTCLCANSNAVQRSVPFKKQRVLKVKDYARGYERKYKHSEVKPGSTVSSAAMLLEFSLTQLTYKTAEQYQAWLKQRDSFKRKYNQSLEMFFLNEDGTLDYQQMIEECDVAVAKGEMGLQAATSKGTKNNLHRYVQPHPELDTLTQAREYHAIRQGLVYQEGELDTVVEE